MGLLSTAEHDDRASLFTAIGNWWHDFVVARQESEELLSLSHDDVERVAHDVGVTYDELVDFARRGAHAADEAPQMMTALGIDAEDVRVNQHSVYVDIVRNCGQCSDKGTCRHDLASGHAAEHFEDYCLNAHTLNALRAINEVGPRKTA